jgi:hypothetical protein
MIFELNDFAVSYTDCFTKDQKTMNRFRCSLFTAIVLIMTSIPAFAGDIQGPGKSDPTPTPIPTALTTAPASDGLTQPTSTDEVQIVGQDSTMLVEILLTIF